MVGQVSTGYLPLMFNQIRSISFLLFLVPGISACGSLGGTYSVHQGVWATYDCPNLNIQIESLQSQIKDQQHLMARAERGAGGAFVNLIAYRSEYELNVARLNEARAEAGRKNCAIQGPTASGRSMY